MLYVTTRIKQDAFTAGRALSENRGPRGGFYVPLHLEALDPKQVKALGEKSFSQNAADVINLLFHTTLDTWALEFAIGRYPVKLASLGSRETVAESWHNPQWRFERLARGVEKAIRQSDQISVIPSDWLLIASRMAVLFGVFGELIRNGTAGPEEPVDVVVPSGNFAAPMAAWYARSMGLPIGNIVCCCNENAGVWNLLHKGELRTDTVAVQTTTPLCDYAVAPDLERLIFGKLGLEMAVAFSETCRRGGTFYLEPNQHQTLREGMHACVVSQRRLESAIPNLYKTSGYVADPYTALCYSGLMDYRSKTGESRHSLILSEESPVHTLSYLAGCMGVSPMELKKRMSNS